MLATSNLPPSYAEWNQVHGAPFGRNVPRLRLKKYFLSPDAIQRQRGPFAIQGNNSIRAFEYPWAFEAGKLQPGMRVMEIGGGLAGFQFVMDSLGCQVVNVDPGMEAKGVGWLCDQGSMAKLNGWFNSRVELRNTTIEKAELAENSFDRVFSISVLEHLTDADLANAMTHVFRCLKPGGLFVITADLFLNLKPFCSREKNEYGKNQNIKMLLESARWELASGDRTQMYGFEEFNVDHIMSNLEKFLIGKYPAMAQCFVLRKPVSA